MKQGSPCGTFTPGITLLGVVIRPRARSRGETFGSQQQMVALSGAPNQPRALPCNRHEFVTTYQW